MPVQSFQCGPSGGDGGDKGRFADDIPADGVRVTSIFVWHGTYVDAIQLQYSDGTMTEKHGGDGGQATVLTLDAGEFIYEVSGQYGHVVDSLTIRTNVQTFQPLGGRGGTQEYRYQVLEENMEIIGFHGSHGDQIDALGIIGRVRARP